MITSSSLRSVLEQYSHYMSTNTAAAIIGSYLATVIKCPSLYFALPQFTSTLRSGNITTSLPDFSTQGLSALFTKSQQLASLTLNAMHSTVEDGSETGVASNVSESGTRVK